LILGGGTNVIEVYEAPQTAPENWDLSDTGLQNVGGSTHISAPDLTFLQLHIHGTDVDDVYTITKYKFRWFAEFYGGNGNDTLQMGATKDIDAVFNGGTVNFFGEGGVDTIDFSDIQGALGNNDDYYIEGSNFWKAAFNATPAGQVVVFTSSEKFLLQLDNDTNRMFLSLGNLSDV